MTFTYEEKPKLFTKTAIFVFSVLLSTFFGSLLFATNLKELNKKKEIFSVVLFAVIWNIISMKFLGKFISNGLIVYGITNVLGGLILVFPIWNSFLKELADYRRRKIWIPLIMLIIVIGGFMVFLFLQTKNIK